MSCDDFLPRTHAHSHTRFSAARTSHACAHFAKNQMAHARVRFSKIRTRTFAQSKFFFDFICVWSRSRFCLSFVCKSEKTQFFKYLTQSMVYRMLSSEHLSCFLIQSSHFGLLSLSAGFYSPAAIALLSLKQTFFFWWRSRFPF